MCCSMWQEYVYSNMTDFHAPFIEEIGFHYQSIVILFVYVPLNVHIWKPFCVIKDLSGKAPLYESGLRVECKITLAHAGGTNGAWW